MHNIHRKPRVAIKVDQALAAHVDVRWGGGGGWSGVPRSMQLEAFCRLFALGQPLAMALISFRQTKSDSLQYMSFSALIPPSSPPPFLPSSKKAMAFELTTKCSQGTCLNFVLKHRIHWANLSCSLGRQLRPVLRSLKAITEASLNAFGVSSWYAAYVPSLNLDRKRFALHLTFAVCPSIT